MKTRLKAVRLDTKILDSLGPIMKKKNYNFSTAVTEALENYINEQKLHEAVDNSYGLWKDKDHPELKGGTDAYVRKIRKARKF